jgi:hypothetical protein
MDGSPQWRGLIRRQHLNAINKATPCPATAQSYYSAVPAKPE